MRMYGAMLGDTEQQRAQIESGPADENGNLPGRMGVIDHAARFVGPARGIMRVGAVDVAEEVVGHSVHLVVRGACRENREVGIDLAGVGVDDLRVGAGVDQRFRERNRQSALAACGGSGNKRDGRPPGEE